MLRLSGRLMIAAFAASLLASPLPVIAQDKGAAPEAKAAPEAPNLDESYGKLSKQLKASKKAAKPSKSAKSDKAIQPGRDLQPQFSDRGRVDNILKILADVYYGRPLQYPKDGTVFSNREGLLPQQPKGYYREYTVIPPPDSPLTLMIGDRTFHMQAPNGTRGAERLVLGAGDEAYYCPDHYKTFIRLTVVR